jgi:hypothetical protein
MASQLLNDDGIRFYGSNAGGEAYSEEYYHPHEEDGVDRQQPQHRERGDDADGMHDFSKRYASYKPKVRVLLEEGYEERAARLALEQAARGEAEDDKGGVGGANKGGLFHFTSSLSSSNAFGRNLNLLGDMFTLEDNDIEDTPYERYVPVWNTPMLPVPGDGGATAAAAPSTATAALEQTEEKLESAAAAAAAAAAANGEKGQAEEREEERESHTGVLAAVHSTTEYSLTGQVDSQINVQVDASVALEGGGVDLNRKRVLRRQGELEDADMRAMDTRAAAGIIPGIGDTFLTGVAFEEEDHGSQPMTRRTDGSFTPRTQYVPLGEITSIEMALMNLPEMILEETCELPPVVNLAGIMESATSKIRFKLKSDRAAWIQYFGTPESQNIIRDAHWFVLTHFFSPAVQDIIRTDPEELALSAPLLTSTIYKTPSYVPAQGDPSIEQEPNGINYMRHAMSTLAFDVPQVTAHPVLAPILDRLATNFVELFAIVESQDKDSFFEYYFDGLAQCLYYALSSAYPESRHIIHLPLLRCALLIMTSKWTLGFVPELNNRSADHWQVIRLHAKQESLHERVDRTVVATDHHRNLDTKLENLFSELQAHPAAEQDSLRDWRNKTPSKFGHTHTGARMQAVGGQAAFTRDASSNINNGGSSSNNAAPNAPSSSGSSNPNATSSSSAATAAAAAASSGGSGAAQGQGAYPRQVSFADAPGVTTTTDGDPLVYKVMNTEHSRIPLKVQRKYEYLAHSQLVAHYLHSQTRGFKPNLALKLHVTRSSMQQAPTDSFLNEMKIVNQLSAAKYAKLQKRYRSVKRDAARQNARDMKDFAEQTLSLVVQKERAMADAAVFSKALVVEYQDNRYAELREPSKSLSLRRLGHYRNYHSEEIAGSIINREARNAVLRSTISKKHT